MMKRLGKWQYAKLKELNHHKKGIACYLLMDLSGKAKEYRSKYVQSIHNAVEAHNQNKLKESPIDKDYFIQIGPYGVRGGYGFRLVPRVLL